MHEKTADRHTGRWHVAEKEAYQFVSIDRRWMTENSVYMRVGNAILKSKMLKTQLLFRRPGAVRVSTQIADALNSYTDRCSALYYRSPLQCL